MSFVLVMTLPSTLQFKSERSDARIIFAPAVLQHFDLHRQQGKQKTEVGGQLFAALSAMEMSVQRATGPGTLDKRGWSWFIPNRQSQNAEIKRLFRERLHFVGDWHTHPERVPSPSSIDLQSMAECFAQSRHQLTSFVMVIVGRAPFPDGLFVSLHRATEWEQLKPL